MIDDLNDAHRQMNEKHINDPMPGDYWHEMFTGICVVLAVDENNVTICRKKKDVDRDHWTWDLSEKEVMTRLDFKTWLSYGTIPGTWADVSRKRHKWAIGA